jgi:hypothetical protein
MSRIRDAILERFGLRPDDEPFSLLMSSIDARACYKPYEKVSASLPRKEVDKPGTSVFFSISIRQSNPFFSYAPSPIARPPFTPFPHHPIPHRHPDSSPSSSLSSSRLAYRLSRQLG